MPTFLFDLDGTLIDSVYQHVIAWRAALEDIGIDLSVWRIHRRIGMSGGLFVQALLRETGRSLSPEEIARLQQAHAVEYRKQLGSVTALPGARDLLAALTDAGVRWAIATSGYALTARPALELLGLPEDTPMVTRDLVRHAKPDPDLFLAAAALLGVEPQHAMVVGDSVWDLLAARRAGSLGIGLQSGGYGREELERAGAYRVYADPAEMLSRVDEIGVRLDDNTDGLPTLPVARIYPARVLEEAFNPWPHAGSSALTLPRRPPPSGVDHEAFCYHEGFLRLYDNYPSPE